MERIAVVGAGVIGMSAAAELLKAGHQVEIFDPTPGRGASAGPARIFRQGHQTDPLVTLSGKNRLLWKEWEGSRGASLLFHGGLLYLGEDAGQWRDLLGDHEITHRWLQIGRLGGTEMSFDHGLWEPGAGTIWSQQVLWMLRDILEDRFIHQRVWEVEDCPSGVKVWTDSGAREFDRALIVPGEGITSLRPEWSKEISLTKKTILRLAFDLQSGSMDATAAFIDHNIGAYGLPMPGFRRYAVGCKGGNLAEMEAAAIALVQSSMPGLVPEPVEAVVCTAIEIDGEGDSWAFTSEGRTTVFAGGNLFKWAPLHGQQLARAVLGQELDIDWLEFGDQSVG